MRCAVNFFTVGLDKERDGIALHYGVILLHVDCDLIVGNGLYTGDKVRDTVYMFNRGSCNIFGDALIVYGITFLQIFIKRLSRSVSESSVKSVDALPASLPLIISS